MISNRSRINPSQMECSKSIVVVLKRLLPVLYGGSMNTHFTLPGELLLQRLERQQVVAEDQPVVEDVVVRDAMLGVI
jgi:hypothetical protein